MGPDLQRLPCLPWLLLFVASLGVGPVANGQETNKWIYRGKEIVADFVRVTDNGVVLRNASGKEAEVPFSDLDLKSHLQALKLADPEAFSKPLIKADVPAEIAEPEFTLDPAELLKSPFSANTSIEEYLSKIKEDVEKRNWFILWHCLPNKMQTDTALLVEKAADKLGSSAVTQVRTIMGNLNTIVRDKHEYIMAHPLVTAQPELAAELEKIWPSFAGLVAALAAEDLWQPENFKKENVPTFLAKFIAATAPYSVQLDAHTSQMVERLTGQPSNNKLDYRILSQSNGNAEVELLAGPITSPKLTLRKTGNQWIPGKEMSDMRQALDKALASVDSVDNSVASRVQLALIAINGAVGSLADANSQQDFNEKAQTLIDLFKTLAPENGPGGAPNGGQGPRGGRRGGGRGGP
ncbi:MAG: hypothetical protein KDB22_17500 [Planctomycetales bacterium]|nr:hypothetical protein [Planctomycetales bacterium]